jgi:hypothetical protein
MNVGADSLPLMVSSAWTSMFERGASKVFVARPGDYGCCSVQAVCRVCATMLLQQHLMTHDL